MQRHGRVRRLHVDGLPQRLPLQGDHPPQPLDGRVLGERHPGDADGVELQLLLAIADDTLLDGPDAKVVRTDEGDPAVGGHPDEAALLVHGAALLGVPSDAGVLEHGLVDVGHGELLNVADALLHGRVAGHSRGLGPPGAHQPGELCQVWRQG